MAPLIHDNLAGTPSSAKRPAMRTRPTFEKRTARETSLAAILIALAVLVSRLQTFSDPVLGFDEQYYLLVADRMLHGAVPYVDIWDRKPIGLFLIYAAAILPGADPFLSYKLLAALFVGATAFAIWRGARVAAGPFGAGVAALLYVFWLNFMEGEGGQAPVFYNLPVLLAALLVRRAVERRGSPGRDGLTAMLLAGISLQIKYTAVFESAFFGLALIWAGWRAWGASQRLALTMLGWLAALLAPTLIAWGAYAAIGQSQAFVFANFVSVFGRLPDPLADRMMGLALIVTILSPLAVIALLASRQMRFVQLWALAAAFGVLAFGAFLSPSYGLPVVPPLCLCAAPWFDGGRLRRWVGGALLALSLGGGVFAVHKVMIGKGNREQALAIAAAAQPRHGGCMWVWDGYPALYMLTGSCIPTRLAFPGQLNAANENSPRAAGVDPVDEVRRILAGKPETIVDDYPPFDRGNRATRAVLEAELARSYLLAARIQTGRGRFRLVFRRRPDSVHAAGTSP
jgi:hypothetical protein